MEQLRAHAETVDPAALEGLEPCERHAVQASPPGALAGRAAIAAHRTVDGAAQLFGASRSAGR